MGQVSSRISNLFNDKTKDDLTKSKLQSKNKSIFNREVKHFSSNEFEILHDGSITNSSILMPPSSYATPRLPLKRTREISPVTAELPQKILDLISPCSKKLRMDDEFLNFPFLNDSQTVDYLRKCKVLFIMRGVPGSGKSTITKYLRKTYASVEICTADDFFMVDNEYQFDPKKISEAHKFCKRKAVDASVSEVMTIIIDNTNMKFWEIKFYLDLAKTFYYIPIIVESKTPWKNDVKILVEKNTHNLDEKDITVKINNFEKLNPLYYGWFINEKDSYLLNLEGQSWIEDAFSFSIFLKDLSTYSGVKNFKEFLEIYSLPGNSPLFHVTSKYTARKRKSPEIATYIENEEVESSIGRAYDLEIVCFVITPRTFGARVKLSKEQEVLWGGDDDESVPSEFWNVCPLETSFAIVNSQNGIEDQELSFYAEKADEIQIADHVENCENLEETVEINLDIKQSVIEQHSAEVETDIMSETDNDITNDVINIVHKNGNCKIVDKITSLRENSTSVIDSNNHNNSLNILNVEHSLENDNQEINQIAINVIGDINIYNTNNHNTSLNILNGEQSFENVNQEINQNAIIVTEDSNTDLNNSAHEFLNSIKKQQKNIKNTDSSKKKVSPLDTEPCRVNAALTSPSKMLYQAKLFSPNKRKSPNKSKSPSKQDVFIPGNDIKPVESKVGDTIKEVLNKSTLNKFRPTSGIGRRAHITLGCKPDIAPVTTGLDLLFAIELETKVHDEYNEKDLSELNASMNVMGVEDPQKSWNCSKSDIIHTNKTFRQTIQLNGATAKNYGYGVWVIYLEKKLVVSSVFNLNC